MSRWTIALCCLLIGCLAGTFLAGPALHGQSATGVPIPNIPKELTSYRDVVKGVLPAVVSIQGQVNRRPAISRNRTSRDDSNPETSDPTEEMLRRFFGRRFGESADSTPEVGFGSGFIVDASGVILTNYHVVNGADQLEIQLQDGRKFLSKDIKVDRQTDLAIVRINVKEPLPRLELGDSDALEIGDRVLAVGAPFRLAGTVTAGIISGKNRSLNVNMYEDFLQTDAAINPGNSGGPLVNLAGQVIGINSAIKSGTGGFMGVGMAISSKMAKTVMQSLLTEGVVHRGYLGIQVQDLTPEIASQLGIAEGVVVGNVFDHSPAAKADIKAGDVITAIGGKPVKSGRELQMAVVGLPLNKPVDVRVYHDGKSVDKPVTILEQPKNYGQTVVSRNRSGPSDEDGGLSLDKIGLAVKDLTPELAQEAGFKEGAKGVVITHVEDNSIAGEQGLQPRMLIVKANKKSVRSAEQLQEIIDKASLDSGILIQLQLADGTVLYRVLKSQPVK